jgi:hypothetical protein
MSQDNPFAKLGALDQMLYQEITPKLGERGDEKATDKKAKEKPEETGLLANQQTSKVVKKQTSKPANLQTSKPANQQTSEVPLSTKEKKKYGTYLREDSILDIQLQALQSKRKDHEVLQEAVDFYFANKKK